MKNNGFTLVELLVVIAIIGILAGALIIAINPQSMVQKSQDADRLTNMDTLASAIMLALAEDQITLVDTTAGGTAPICGTCTSDTGSQYVDGSGWIVLGSGSLQRYIPALPLDPENEAPIVYTFGSDGTNFELNCVLVHPDNVAAMTTDGGSNDEIYEIGSNLYILP